MLATDRHANHTETLTNLAPPISATTAKVITAVRLRHGAPDLLPSITEKNET